MCLSVCVWGDVFRSVLLMISILQLSSQSVVEIIMLRGDPGRSVKGAPRAGEKNENIYKNHFFVENH